MSGRHYLPVSTAAAELVRPDAVLVCGDALDPPFAPLMFDRVIALNLIDAVPDPGTLFAVIDNLCKPGGEIVLSSPYSWQSAHVADMHRPKGADPAAETSRHWKSLGYQLLEDTDVPWSLRRDARSTVVYAAHYLRARKPR
jgi:SAM-dependent methyltransferase